MLVSAVADAWFGHVEFEAGVVCQLRLWYVDLTSVGHTRPSSRSIKSAVNRIRGRGVTL